jgi:L-threonylcarbamoyladenylate synthase
LKTIILKKDKLRINQKLIKETINASKLVIFPTETVYGIGANALDPIAVKNIYKAKGRPSDNPLILHIASKNDVDKYAKIIDEKALMLINKFWPGPLTLIFKKKAIVPKETTGGLNSVAIRMPDNEIALSIIKFVGVPLAAPSANLSSKPSSTKLKHVIDDFNGKVNIIIDGGSTRIGLESTVLDVSVKPFTLLRPGAISQTQIEKVIKEKIIDKSNQKISGKVKSPGMKYTHYKPKGEVFIFEGKVSQMVKYVNDLKSYYDNKKIIVICEKEYSKLFKVKTISLGSKLDQNEMAHNLFDALRKTDELKADLIYIHHLGSKNLAYPMMNRLIKAAGYKVIKV